MSDQKKGKVWSKTLANVFFSLKRSILLRFANFKKLAFRELADKTNHKSKIYVRIDFASPICGRTQKNTKVVKI